MNLIAQTSFDSAKSFAENNTVNGVFSQVAHRHIENIKGHYEIQSNQVNVTNCYGKVDFVDLCDVPENFQPNYWRIIEGKLVPYSFVETDEIIRLPEEKLIKQIASLNDVNIGLGRELISINDRLLNYDIELGRMEINGFGNDLIVVPMTRKEINSFKSLNSTSVVGWTLTDFAGEIGCVCCMGCEECQPTC